jgi:hypothetical protein
MTALAMVVATGWLAAMSTATIRLMWAAMHHRQARRSLRVLRCSMAGGAAAMVAAAADHQVLAAVTAGLPSHSLTTALPVVWVAGSLLAGPVLFVLSSAVAALRSRRHGQPSRG